MARIWISMLLSVGLPKVSFFFMRFTNAPGNPRNGNGVGEGQQALGAAATVNQDIRKVKILCPGLPRFRGMQQFQQVPFHRFAPFPERRKRPFLAEESFTRIYNPADNANLVPHFKKSEKNVEMHSQR